jgi:hypothetical protein
MTMVPVRELMMTLATAWPTSTSRFSRIDRTRIQRRSHADRTAIQRLGHARAEQVIDLIDDVLRRGEIRAIEVQRQRVALIEATRHRSLDRGTTGDASSRRRIDGNARSIGATGVKAADNQVALSNGIDVAIDPLQGRHQQAAAAQTLGITDGRYGDVDGLPRLGEGWQLGMNRHRGDVLQLDIAAGRHLDAELRQHVVEGLHGERCLGGLVTAAIQANDKAIADQLVAAHTVNGRDILQPLGLSSAAEHE